MENQISPICRFCLDDNEEFHHLANDCPALWFERHTVNAQDQEHSTPPSWSPQQILDFTLFPRINEAFVKPLFLIEGPADRGSQETPQSQDHDPDDVGENSSVDTDLSVMDISSLESSTPDDITVDSASSDGFEDP